MERNFNDDYYLIPNPKERVKEAKSKSVGSNHLTKVNHKKKSNPSILAKRIMALALATVMTISGVIVTKKITEVEEHEHIISTATEILKGLSGEELKYHNLGFDNYEGIFTMTDNDVEDYSKLNLRCTSPEEIYAYYLNCPDNKEFEELVKSATYIDQKLGEECSYISLEQFLKINGFINKDTNAASMTEFKIAMEESLADKLMDGTIRDVVNSNSVSKGKGM